MSYLKQLRGIVAGLGLALTVALAVSGAAMAAQSSDNTTLTTLATAGYTTISANSYTCPTGTVNAGKTVSSAHLCNVDANVNAEGKSDLETSFENIGTQILIVIGVVSVAFLIYGGFLYITSFGDPSKIERAKNAITYTVIGLVVTLVAAAVVTYVVNMVTTKQ